MVKRRYYRWIGMVCLTACSRRLPTTPTLNGWRSMPPSSGPRPSCRSAVKKGGPQAQALGRSRGGFGTKLHAVLDALGLPVRFEIGPGQQNDMAPACGLVAGLATGKVIADRAYDADSLHDAILDQGGEPVIPPRRHRKHQHLYDKIAYKTDGGLKASLPSSNNGGASPPATTSLPPTSSPSSNSPQSCFGSND